MAYILTIIWFSAVLCKYLMPIDGILTIPIINGPGEWSKSLILVSIPCKSIDS
ncbi:hypothetical protein NADFUDRAFT_46794 [Nadsonia fulvescens var. elongata DSM 6958]|uniref:Uncharacterized protein n=1 Tax=Nadsonia fulvescens var. elongata DSM 6958 TaxID=857566 RepID=A0A1E3PJH2_9ASCO|nr:hypothetical protein NADFUDRAFT_46794 [Nadsonia fulvescens var. elongata DSM 6958]